MKLVTRLSFSSINSSGVNADDCVNIGGNSTVDRLGLRGQAGVAVGNVLGSNVMNIMGIIGIASIFGNGIPVDSEFQRDIVVVMATSGFVVWILMSNREFTKNMGSMMILTYLLYMTYLSGFLDGLF